MRTLLFYLISSLLIGGGAVLAQDSQDFDPKAVLEQAQKKLETHADPESEEDKKWREAISRRIEILNEIIRTAGERKVLPDANQIALRKERAETGLEARKAAVATKSVRLNKPEELAKYETVFHEAERRSSEVKDRLNQIKERSGNVPADLERLGELESKARLLLEQLGQGEELDIYRAETARMTLRMVEDRKSYLREGQKIWTALIPVLQLENDLAGLDLEKAQTAFKLAGEEATRLREKQAERLAKKADAEQKAAERERDRIERFRMEVNAEATRLRSETDSIRVRIDELKVGLTERGLTRDRLQQEKDHIEQRLKMKTEGAALLLKSSLDRTIRGKQLLDHVIEPKLFDEMSACESELVTLLDQQWELLLPPSENTRLQALLADVPPERHEEAERAFTEAVRGADGLLTAIRAKRTVLESEVALYGQLSSLIDQINIEYEILSVFLRSRLYWVQSAPTIGASNFVDAGREFQKIGRVFEEQKTLSKVGHSFRTNPRRIIGLLLAIGLIFLAYYVPRKLRRRYMQAMDQQAVSGWRTALYRSFLALLSAALPAAAYLFTAYLIRQMHLELKIRGILPGFLEYLALFTFIRRLGSRFLAAEGVAIRYMGMPRELASQLVRSIKLLTLGGILFYAPSMVLAGEPLMLEHIPRILHLFWLVVSALSILLLIRRKGPLVERCTRSVGFLRQAWILVGPILSLAVLGVIVLDALGFHVASEHLMTNALFTFAAVLLLAGYHGVTVAAVNKIAGHVKKRQKNEKGTVAAWASSEEVMNQLSRLFAFVGSIATLLIILKFWEADLLFSGYLKNLRLIEVRPQEWLTLKDVLTALLWIAGGHFVLHNLSAVYENFVFPLIGQTDKGGRFVFLALSRYVILVVTYSLALLELRFSFSSLGWMLAAVSVGLGFGLQEIVANFVSGLILLLERPIRVGDIITVGDTGGTVEKITIRATVVTNWDRQSIVIPNKNFITQNLTNWTHNDEIMRRVINLRVAYGTDVERLLKILEEIITAHPAVLSDPPHRIWFDSFGQTSLEFVIWFFTAISDGLRTRTELYKQIYGRLEAEGIEIPLPQQVLRMSPETEKQSFSGLLEKRGQGGGSRGPGEGSK